MNRYHIALGKKPQSKTLKKEPEKESYPLLNEKIIENLFETIKLFIAWAPYREGLRNTYQNFNRDFNTFKVSLPRRAGNTTLALKLLELYEDSILIVLGSEQKHDDRCRPYQRRIFGPTGRDLCGQGARIVIIDLASYINRIDIERIFSQFTRSIFILIA